MIAVGKANIVDELVEASENKLQADLIKIISVQKQTQDDQCTRFKAIVAIGDMVCYVGLVLKVGNKVQIAIKGALFNTTLQLVLIRRRYWDNKILYVHTVPGKVTGK